MLGDGKSPVKGDRVVVDWEGYTIGYYGRPFQTRNKVTKVSESSSLKLLRFSENRQFFHVQIYLSILGAAHIQEGKERK